MAIEVRCGAILTQAVAGYESSADIRDYVWARKAVPPHVPAGKVADFAAKRRQSEIGKPGPGQSPLPS